MFDSLLHPISVVTPTRNRRHHLFPLEKCIKNQTVQPSEWIIADSSDDPQEYIPALPCECRWFQIEHHNTGFARNRAVEAATGEIIVHMDDDDTYAPGHIENLVKGLIQSGKQVIGYRSGRFTDGSKVYEYRSTREGYAMGATLAYWRSWWETHLFPGYVIGEDNAFVYMANDLGELATLEGVGYFTGLIHPGNTSPKTVLLGTSEWRLAA